MAWPSGGDSIVSRVRFLSILRWPIRTAGGISLPEPLSPLLPRSRLCPRERNRCHPAPCGRLRAGAAGTGGAEERRKADADAGASGVCRAACVRVLLPGVSAEVARDCGREGIGGGGTAVCRGCADGMDRAADGGSRTCLPVSRSPPRPDTQKPRRRNAGASVPLLTEGVISRRPSAALPPCRSAPRRTARSPCRPPCARSGRTGWSSSRWGGGGSAA